MLLRHGADPRIGRKGSVPLEALKDPELRERLNPGGREVLIAWAEAEELRAGVGLGAAEAPREKAAIRKGL